MKELIELIERMREMNAEIMVLTPRNEDDNVVACIVVSEGETAVAVESFASKLADGGDTATTIDLKSLIKCCDYLGEHVLIAEPHLYPEELIDSVMSFCAWCAAMKTLGVKGEVVLPTPPKIEIS